MRYLSSTSVSVLGSIVLLLVALLGIGAARTAYADSSTSKSGERLIVVHDGTVQQGILTKSTTVRGALEEANILLDPNDLVEPRLDEELVASSYDVNIYRARPITIVDGAIRKKIMSAYRTPVQIVEHADMELRSEDITEMRLPVGGSPELVITRAIPFTFMLYGKETIAYTQATTVADMLEEKGIMMGESDTLSVAPEDSIVANMTIELWREGKQTVTLEEEVAFDIEQVRDADRDAGYREITSPGVKGMRTVIYEIEMKNGVEVGRVEIQSIVTAEPVKQVERVGIKPKYLPYTGGGSKTEWLAAAGIPEQHWGYADYMVGRESGWNPNALNPTSGACGLAQALPCEKVPGNPFDPVDSLRWMNSYVYGRYYDGSPYAHGLCGGIDRGWACAYTFWQAKHWY